MNKDEKVNAADQSDAKAARKAWQPMKLTLAGDAKDVIKHGVNKTSPGTGDPGDIQKVPGQAEH